MEGKTCAEVDSCLTAAEVIAECSAHPQQNRSRSNRLRRARKNTEQEQEPVISIGNSIGIIRIIIMCPPLLAIAAQHACTHRKSIYHPSLAWRRQPTNIHT